MNNVVNYYAGGNTAKGFVHFFDSNFQDLDRLFILKGGPGTGKSTLMKRIGIKWQEQGYGVEWIHCSADYGSVDAIIIPSIRAGIVDGTSPHIIEPALPGIVDEYVNLGVAWDRKKLLPNKENVQRVNANIKESYRKAYHYLERALGELNKELQNASSKEFSALTKWAENWIRTWLKEKNTVRKPIHKHRFYGAFTPDGYHHFAEELLEKVQKRFFLTGSLLVPQIMEKIIRAAISFGHDLHIYYNALDPERVEMIIFPELNVALFDHTLFPEEIVAKENDEWVPFSEQTLKKENNEKLDEYIAKAIEYLGKTSKFRNELESYYIEAMDFAIVEEIGKEIEGELARMLTE